MSEEILVNVTPMETRAVLLENGAVQDVYIERTRLQQMLAQSLAAEGLAGLGGFILRTVAEVVEPAKLVADLRFLQRLWSAVLQRTKAADKPQLLYEDLPLHKRIVRDLARATVRRISVFVQSRCTGRNSLTSYRSNLQTN